MLMSALVNVKIKLKAVWMRHLSVLFLQTNMMEVKLLERKAAKTTRTSIKNKVLILVLKNQHILKKKLSLKKILIKQTAQKAIGNLKILRSALMIRIQIMKKLTKQYIQRNCPS